jgi:anti-sigma-K factor RskA
MSAPPDDILDLLTAYALGVLEPEEIARVSELLEQHPEWRPTLDELRATVGLLPYGLPGAEPAPGLRQRTLDYAAGRSRRPVRAPERGLRRWLAALGGVAAAATLAAGLAWGQLQSARADLARAEAELASLRSAQQQVAATLAQARPLVALSGPGGRGSVLRTSAGVTVVAAKLPALAPGRTYQLWLIRGGKPAGVGTFGVDAQGFGMLTLGSADLAPQATDTFAVTDEPAGGSPGPTTSPLIAGTQVDG